MASKLRRKRSGKTAPKVSAAAHAIGLTRAEASTYLTEQLKPFQFKVTPRMLEKWAANNNAGRGPAFVRYGWRTVRYLKADLDSWLRGRRERVA